MSFVSNAIQNFKTAYQKYSKTNKMNSILQAAEKEATNIVNDAKAIAAKIVGEADKVYSNVKQDMGATVAYFETSTQTVISDIKNQLTHLNDIITKKTKEKSANLEHIQNLTVSHTTNIKNITDANSAIDLEITKAQNLITSLSPLVLINPAPAA